MSADNGHLDDGVLGACLLQGEIPEPLRATFRPDLFLPDRQPLARALLMVSQQVGSCPIEAVKTEMANQGGGVREIMALVSILKRAALPDELPDLVDALEERRRREADCGRWILLDAAQHLEWPVTRPPWLVHPIIAQGTIGYIAGLPKVGKSLAALDLLLHGTHGQDWLGRFAVAKPGPTTLYVAREDPAWRLKDRIAEMQSGYGFPSIPPGRLLILSRERIRLTEKAHLAWLRQIVRERGITFLVFDVLGRMLGTLDLMTEWPRAQDILEELNRDLELTIALLDHTRKPVLGGGKASGASPVDLKGPVERYGGADWMLVLAETDHPGRLEVYAESKDSDQRPHFLIEVAPMGAPGPKLRWVADVEKLAKGSRAEGEANRQAVLSVFKAGDQIGPEEIIRRYREAGGKLDDRSIKRHLGHLAKSNLPGLIREGDGRATSYRLPEDTVTSKNGACHDSEDDVHF